MGIFTTLVVRNPETSLRKKIFKVISDTPLRIPRGGFELLQKHYTNKSEYHERVAEEEKQQSEYFAQAAEQSETEQVKIKNKEHSFEHERKYKNFIEKSVFYDEVSKKIAELKDMFTKEIGDTSLVQNETEIENEIVNESVPQGPAPKKIDLSGLPEINVEEENAKLDERYVIEDERTFEEIYAQVCALLGEDSDLKSDLDALLSLEEDENKKEALINWVENNFAFDLSDEMNAKMYAILDNQPEEEIIKEMSNINTVTNEDVVAKQDNEETEEVIENGVDSEQTELSEDIVDFAIDAGEFADEELENTSEETIEEVTPEEVFGESAEMTNENQENTFPEVEEKNEVVNDEVETPSLTDETILYGNNFYGSNFEEDINNPNENPEDIKWLVDEVNKAYEEEYQQELTERLNKAEEIFKTDNLSEENVEEIEKGVEESLRNKYEINSYIDAFRDELLSQGFNEDTEENKKNLDYILGLKRELEEEKKLTGEKSERVRELESVINEKLIGLKPESKEFEQTSEVEEIIEEPIAEQTFEQPVIEGWEEAIKPSEKTEVEKIERLQTEYDKLVIENSELLQQLEKAEERTRLAEENSVRDNEAKAVARSERNAAESKADLLEDEISELKEERIVDKEKIGSLETEVSKLKEERTTDKEKIGSLETEVSELKEERTTDKEKIGSLETENSELKEERTVDKEKIGSLETEVSELKDEKTKDKAFIESLETEISELRKLLSQVALDISERLEKREEDMYEENVKQR